MKKLTDDLYWAAGFLEGEGCFTPNRTQDRKRGYARIAATQVQRWPLEQLRTLFGGQLRMVKSRHEGWSDQWRWTASSKRAVEAMMTVYSLMSPRRREQIKAALGEWKLRPPAPAFRTSCPQGHSYTGENLKIKVTNGRNPQRLCRECWRIRSRRVYAAKQQAWGVVIEEANK